MTIDDTATLSDDELLSEVRAECARWEARDELESGFARLFRLRDEMLRRGLPLPMSCPMDDRVESSRAGDPHVESHSSHHARHDFGAFA
jgi:hypothetical protein